MLDKKELLFDELYEKYKHCCQIQFIKLLMGKEREIEELKKQLEDANEKIILLQASKPMLNYKKAVEETQQKEFIKCLEDEIYNIEPKGTGINYNCEYDSEEDYVRAMQEQSRLNTLKESLQKYKEIIGDDK